MILVILSTFYTSFCIKNVYSGFIFKLAIYLRLLLLLDMQNQSIKRDVIVISIKKNIKSTASSSVKDVAKIGAKALKRRLEPDNDSENVDKIAIKKKVKMKKRGKKSSLITLFD